MPKQKTPTPQEIYRARKEREEQEKNALLPPGLINHGNTCFMNSVLQGLIATQYLVHLVQFQALPSVVQHSALTPISSRRSPELTNGHGLGGEYEEEWTAGMPIGDKFVSVLLKAWDVQDHRKRENMSPKDILASLGKKYEQYLDFRQQDAHEFLRQLLDAMRMEETDIIKKRQPQTPRKRKTSSKAFISSSAPPSVQIGQAISPSPSPLAQVMSAPHEGAPPIPEEEKLQSFVDMLFGGKLTSVLVCQHCKHISHTYEDFNDLSLSIKPEDYVRGRKRDRLKELAKKLRTISGSALGVSAMQRSSSVPASPRRDPVSDEPELVEPGRRRSADFTEVDREADVTENIKEQEVTLSVVSPDGTPILEQEDVDLSASGVVEDKGKVADRVEFVDPKPKERKEKRDKDSDGWSRLGRRISMSVGLSKSSKDSRSRSRAEVNDKKRLPSQQTAEGSEASTQAPSTMVSGALSGPILNKSQAETPGLLEHSSPALRAVDAKSIETSLSTNHVGNLLSSSNFTRPALSPSLSSIARYPLVSRPSSPSVTRRHSRQSRLPKLTAEESAYLHHILGDVQSSSASPFAFLNKPNHRTGRTASPNPQSMWAKMPYLPRIEDCLRMFTAVEALDGENVVGCHRCWKLEHGLYQPKRSEGWQDSSCTDSDEEEEEEGESGQGVGRPKQEPDVSPADDPHRTHTDDDDESFARPSRSSSVGSSSFHSISASVDSTTMDTGHDSDIETADAHPTGTSLEPKPHPKTPPSLHLDRELTVTPAIRGSPGAHLTTFGGLPIPSISTTAPESPMSAISTARPSTVRAATFSPSVTRTSLASSSSKDSYLVPRPRRRRSKDVEFESAGESTDEFSEPESVGSADAISGFSSLSASPFVSPNASQERVTTAPASSTPQIPPSSNPSRVPRSKQVIMRPAYKRYLIAIPPPILVIHLKRFQQTSSKTPVVSFSGGFKKLDDYVSFPEYLDLAPYLIPDKETFGKGQSLLGSKANAHIQKCMYRLYAVVVHLGNMLGGHYIAYTALPPSPPTNPSEQQLEKGSADSHPGHPAGLPKQDKQDNKSLREWAYISDTMVRLATLEEVLKSKAYLCMYERI